MTKEIFWKGLFIRNDSVGRPCHVGDSVTVVVDSHEIEGDSENEGHYFTAKKFTWILMLSKTSGVYLRVFHSFEEPEPGKFRSSLEEDFEWIPLKFRQKAFKSLKMTDATRVRQYWLKEIQPCL